MKIKRLVELIGDSSLSKESSFKRGLKEIKNSLQKSGITVTNRQIKNFVSRKKLKTKIKNVITNEKEEKLVIRVPYLSYHIFQKINELVHNNSRIVEFCQHTIPTKKTVSNCLCRDVLCSNFYNLLDKSSVSFEQKDKKAYQTFEDFHKCKINCKKEYIR